MSQIYEFKIDVLGLEKKVYRTIEFTDTCNVARLAYTVLASFNTAMYHQYQVEYEDRTFDCHKSSPAEGWFSAREDAKLIRLKDLNLKLGDDLTMAYDFGTTWIFVIVLTKIREMESDEHNIDFPIITQGQGYGIIEDVSPSETLQVINAINQTGKSDFYAFSPSGKNELWDYRNYSVLEDNLSLVQKIYHAIVAYEELSEY